MRVFLFQTLRVFTPEDGVLDLGSPTIRSLFAYLLLNRARPVDRRRLAALFWPRGTESAARRNLRQYLHLLRRTLDPIDPQGELLNVDGSSLQFNPQAEIWLDTDAFRHGTRPNASLPELQDALSLYTGDLLEDVYEAWCDEERARLRQTYIAALDRVSEGLREAGRYDEAMSFAQQWASAEPLDEAAHRCLMRLFVLTGDRHRALQHYRMLIGMLKQELDTEPLPETQSLFQAIQSGALQPEQPAPPPAPAPARSAPRPTAPPPLPLVGRQAQLDRLCELREAARAGHGRFVLISGESGLGKTRLVDEYLHRQPVSLLVRGSCHELEQMIPYAPLRQTFHSVHELLPELTGLSPPPWAAALAPLLPALAPRFPFLSAPDTLRMIEALTQLVQQLSSRAGAEPLHFLLDDLHWGDSATWDFLAHLARHIVSAPVLVIGLCRLEDLPPERRTVIRTLERHDLLATIPLQRFTLDETTELAHHLLAGADPAAERPDQMRRLYQETEGNPFFIVETVRAMRETGELLPRLAEPGLGPALPATIQRVIEARLDRLAPPSRELLAAAATIGRVFTFALLEDITAVPAEDIIRHTEEWLQRGLVREAVNGYDFNHDKIRAVAYAGLSRVRREYLHRRIAETLLHTFPPPDPATIAYHYTHSDQPLRALPHLTRAGEQALWVRSYQAAREFGLQAINLLGRMPGSYQSRERLDLNLQLAQAYAFTGDLPRALEILNETERLAITLGDESRLGQVFHRSAQLFWLRGQPVMAGDYARRTLRAAEELNDPRLLQAALRMLGRVSIALAAFDDAIAYFLRYANLENTATRPPDLSIVLGYLGVAYARVGSWARASEAAERGLELAKAQSSQEATTFARMQLGFIHAAHNDWQACLDVLDPAPEALAATGAETNALTPPGFMYLSLRGYALAHLHQAQQGTKLIRRAIAWARQTDHRVFRYVPQFFLGECLLLAGELEEAQAEVERALEEARTVGNRWAVGAGLRLLAEILTRQPSPDWVQIEDDLIESMQTLRQIRARPDLARTYLTLRRLYDRAGQIAWAVDCHFRATSLFDELGMDEELRRAQGQPAGERRGAVVIPHLPLRGPNVSDEEMG